MAEDQFTDRQMSDAGATTKNKNLQAKLARKPSAPLEKSVGFPAEQDSLLQSGLKRMQTVSDAVKTKGNMATKDKINDVVASRKQISKQSGKATVATKGPSKASAQKAISLKR